MVRAEKEEVDLDDLEKHVEELARHEMNGRQIRNIFTTSRQLALYRKEALEWDHLEQALRSVSDFSRYLRKLHGHSSLLSGIFAFSQILALWKGVVRSNRKLKASYQLCVD